MRRLPKLRVVGGQGSGKNALSEGYEGARGRGARGRQQVPIQKHILKTSGGSTGAIMLLAGAVLLGSAPAPPRAAVVLKDKAPSTAARSGLVQSATARARIQLPSEVWADVMIAQLSSDAWRLLIAPRTCKANSTPEPNAIGATWVGAMGIDPRKARATSTVPIQMSAQLNRWKNRSARLKLKGLVFHEGVSIINFGPRKNVSNKAANNSKVGTTIAATARPSQLIPDSLPIGGAKQMLTAENNTIPTLKKSQPFGEHIGS